uniref:Cerebellar deration related protein 2 n=1 Tax=Cynoglossus semilaevis TaxID=244447 RepID=A0A3P8W1I5_CYNSE
MLRDMIVEEEFEIKEEEPWYDKQDLEHDLQLAAELGKTLLERNRELEQGLQQMISTNHEQLQEIEYLTKQVDLLREVNDQHAKVYEQLDVSARELEHNNLKLAQDNRAAQQKIEGLMEIVDLLQTQVEELQHQVEELRLSRLPPKPQHRDRSSTQYNSLVSMYVHRCDANPDEPSDNLKTASVLWREQEQASLQQSLHSLQIQFAGERAQREEVEREAELLARENAALEQKLAGLDGCRARILELEREAEELRQLWKSESSTRSSTPNAFHSFLSNSMLLQPEEEDEAEGVAAVAKSPAEICDHECSCIRRAEVVKYRGISLLSEVDAQYSALQVKYDELLRRCQPELQEGEEDGQSHKSVQTLSLSSVCSALTHMQEFEEDFHQPEYKELFREIFSRIQKTKEDLIENRGGPSAAGVPKHLVSVT